MPSWKNPSYILRRSASGTLPKVTLLRGTGDQIAWEARASSGASVGRQWDRVRDIFWVYGLRGGARCGVFVEEMLYEVESRTATSNRQNHQANTAMENGNESALNESECKTS